MEKAALKGCAMAIKTAALKGGPAGVEEKARRHGAASLR
jgi:hypothetical protein